MPRVRRETASARARRRRIVAGVSVAGTGLLGLSFATEPDSKEFYAATLAAAGVWAVGGVASGPLHLGRSGRSPRRPVLTPIAIGAGAFGLCYAAALAARRIPVLDGALRDVLSYADRGSTPLVLLTTLANGAAEEVFFRGAVYSAVGEKHPVATSTAVYTLTTAATRNPALVLAAAAMGTLFGLQRRATGGVQAPMLTHLTWASLMVRYVTPLFRGDRPDGGARGSDVRWGPQS
ncbi:MAG: type II CAAX endopeptidase family protein [Mycobacteriales bacterium]